MVAEFPDYVSIDNDYIYLKTYQGEYTAIKFL